MAEGELGLGMLDTDIPGIGLGESVCILSKAYSHAPANVTLRLKN